MLASMTIHSPSGPGPRPRPDAGLLVLLEPLAEVERGLRAAALGDEAPPWVRCRRPSRSSVAQVLADRDRGHGEPRGEVPDAGAALLLDEAGDVVLALAGEDVAGRGAGRGRSQTSPLGPGVRGHRGFGWFLTHSSTAIRNVKKPIEIKRNLWQASMAHRSQTGKDIRPGPAATTSAGSPPTRRRSGREPSIDSPYHRRRLRTDRRRRATEADVTSDPTIVATLPGPADRAAVVGVRQLRHPVQGVRPAGRPARPVREDRRRRPGAPVHRRRADGRAAHPLGQGRRLRATSPATPRTCGVALGHDQLQHLPGRRLHAGQRLPPGRARPAQGHRPPARVRRHHGRDRLARPEAVVRRRHELPGPGRHPRPPGPAGRGARRPSTRGSATDQRMRARVQVLRAGVLHDRRARLGHGATRTASRSATAGAGRRRHRATTRPGTNIEFIVASLLRAGQARRRSTSTPASTPTTT